MADNSLILCTIIPEKIGNYVIESLLGRGSFGTVYKAKNDLKPHGKAIAMKVESNRSSKPRLRLEYEILKAMNGKTGFPNVYRYKKLKEHRIMTMDILGPNLEEQRKKLGMFAMETAV